MDTPPPEGRAGRRALLALSALLMVLIVLLCLLPRPENDLFFELRIGADILHTRHLPRFDTYSWVNHGRRWDVPEWLAFVCYALAFQAGGFFGTWALMATLALAAAGAVWTRLARRVGAAWAFAPTVLMLLAMRDCLQERPYAFTYVLLPMALVLVGRGRATQPRALLGLPPLCALWTNLHQGVVVLLGILAVYTLSDTLTAAWAWARESRAAPLDLLAPGWEEAARTRDEERRTGGAWRRHRAQAARMAWTALACVGAAMLSPYGWRVFWNVWITVHDPTLMSHVTEWNSALTLPLVQLQPFLLVAALAFGSLAVSPRRGLGDALALAALFWQALLHARSIPLFALAATVICTPHFDHCARALRRQGLFASRSAARGALFAGFALACALAVSLVSLTALRKNIGPRGYSPEGIGEAVARVPTYPADACAFVQSEGFPPHLRLLNNFEIGGFLLWRLPQEPVFIDGRLDVYVGRTFDDMLTLSRGRAAPGWAALVQHYDFDCVLTTSAREASAFESDPQWCLVYSGPASPSRPRCRILLRRRPQFAALIARCLRDQSGPPAP